MNSTTETTTEAIPAGAGPEPAASLVPDQVTAWVENLAVLRRELARVIVGQDEVIDLSLITLLAEGHVLLEGVPGLGKTMLVRSLASAMRLRFNRIQFTPDLMPADVVGSTMIERNEKGDYRLDFEPGPVFANLLLADEINRASPKTQSALLEAMQERAVTVRGQRHPLPRPFQVLATQNPLEMEGTYPLPEAQIDRFFFKIMVRQPSHDELVAIIDRTVNAPAVELAPCLDAATLAGLQAAVRAVVVPPVVSEVAVRLTMSTQPEQADSPADVRRFVRYGAGPRGAQTLVLAAKARALIQGRFNASLEDLEACLLPALRHRLALNFDGQSEGVEVDSLLSAVWKSVANERDWAKAVRPERA